MAVTDPTTNFGWDLPADGGADGAWGAVLREIFGGDDAGIVPNGSIDSILGAVQTTANAAMPKAGGIFTGEIDIFTARYEAVNLGATLSGGVAIDLDAGNFFYGTVTGDITISFSNVPSDMVAIVIELTDSGGNNITWPASVDWPSASQPSPTSDGVDVYVAYTRDGGTTWRVARSMTDSS